MHSAIRFQYEHPQLATEWYQQSDFLCFLVVKDEPTLQSLLDQAIQLRIEIAAFREPDLDNQLTAITLAPTPLTKQLCRGLPLALKDTS